MFNTSNLLEKKILFQKFYTVHLNKAQVTLGAHPTFQLYGFQFCPPARTEHDFCCRCVWKLLLKVETLCSTALHICRGHCGVTLFLNTRVSRSRLQNLCPDVHVLDWSAAKITYSKPRRVVRLCLVPKIFQDYLSHRFFGHVYEALNVV